jgi:hypothetical protein
VQESGQQKSSGVRYWGIRTPEQLLGKSGVHLSGTGLLESAYWLVVSAASTSNNYFRFTFFALNSA